VDGAVALVPAYLRINGYFTVTEFPLVECREDAGYRTATDLDLLACRFPSAGQVVLGPHESKHAPLMGTDPALAVPDGVVDMIVGEVKESLAGFNTAGMRIDVLTAALVRFGCCSGDAPSVASQLLSGGIARTGSGHSVRMVAFGTSVSTHGAYHQVALGSVVRYLERYVHRNWSVLKHTQSKDDALAFLMIREKIRSAGS